MIEVSCEALDRTIETGRIIGEVGKDKDGPLVIITAGLHGNEPCGVFAAHDLLDYLSTHEDYIRGRVVAIAGNLKALQSNQRLIDVDLNRIWNEENNGQHEYWEREQLLTSIEQATVGHEKGFKVHIDLHATSGPTMPFVVIKNSEPNVEFVRKIPIPAVLGLDKVIREPLLSMMCDRGYISIAFEGGVIGHRNTYRNHLAFVWAALAEANALSPSLMKQEKYDLEALERQTPFKNRHFDLEYAHILDPNDEYEMLPGFANFEPVEKGDVLGKDRNGHVVAPANGHLFMPKYQKQGREGFFIVR